MLRLPDYSLSSQSLEIFDCRDSLSYAFLFGVANLLLYWGNRSFFFFSFLIISALPYTRISRTLVDISLWEAFYFIYFKCLALSLPCNLKLMGRAKASICLTSSPGD